MQSVGRNANMLDSARPGAECLSAEQARQGVPDVATVMADHPQRVHSPIHYSPGNFKVPLPGTSMHQQYPYHHPMAPADRLHDAVSPQPLCT